MKAMPKILIVDDEQRLCESIKFLLERYEFDVDFDTNPVNALQNLPGPGYDLFLMDISMPGMDGFQLMEHVLGRIPGALVIIMTGNASVESAVRALKKGAYDFIKKPFEHEELIKTVSNAIEKKKLKNENKNIAKKLDRSKRDYQYLIQSSPDLIYILDSENRFVFTNSAFGRHLGYEGKELIGKPFNYIIKKESIDGINSLSNKRRKINQMSNGFELELCHFGEDNECKIFEIMHMAIDSGGRGLYTFEVTDTENDKKFTGTYGIGRDITIRKALEVRLNQNQKMDAIGTLAGGIAHDFNNILAAIMGNVELAQFDIEDDNPVGKCLDQILKASYRAKDLVMQILDFSRQSKVDRRAIQVKPIIREALKLLRASLPSTIEIRTSITPEVCPVLADSTQIHQVLINLCTNAKHAMAEKGGVLMVGLQPRELDADNSDDYPDLEPGRYLELSISDTGYGMDTEIQKRIFDPYFTTKEKHVGTGMGLSVVHGIVKSYGGSICVESNKKVGTIFKVLFPIVENMENVQGQTVAHLPTGKERILFVDDERVLADIGKEMLERLGYSVAASTGPNEALEVFKIQPDAFDLVITDMTMPRMTGDMLAKEIMQIRTDIPILLCSGFSEIMNVDKANSIGIKDFLMKPLAIQELAYNVRKAIDEA